ncbi:purine-nucleoside phosphorylase [Pseudarcicella hirudinis]|uniref:Purine nucleoside phosphorylase n=1 Tax=Pseudarcicella hirudinis TaxID=1079859 RepID=A0A1I5Y671_9BACT|nr:purine-nucleoside phosphorylase [Pseudarcicella hirudinis]SFQ39654.1 purine-nucleoside phosphorylase [Pseudarcicella hirudinis]
MYYHQIIETTKFIQNQLPDFLPEYGVILGTGLGALVNEIEIHHEIPYEEIPHFPVSTVETHKGKLILGTIAGKNVVCMQGRFHFYEGYSMKQVTFPVRVMKKLGIEKLIVSNASGGLNPDFQVSDLMIIEDHISLFMPENPLTGRNIDQMGDRFPDMSEVYDPEMIRKADKIASSKGIKIRKGVYVMVSGPQLETKAEYRLLRNLGADAVGMSTIPEIIIARQMEMACFGVSVITDLCIPETLEKAELSQIIANAAKAEPALTLIIKELISS